MKKLTLKQRLVLLIGSLIFAQATVVTVAIYESGQLLKTLDHLSITLLPATREISIAEMHHEGLSTQMYNALYYYQTKNFEGLNELAKKTKDHSDKLTTTMNDLISIKIETDLDLQIKETQSHVAKYIQAANAVIESAKLNQKEKIQEAKNNFIIEFKYLEENFEKIGERFESVSSAKNNEGKNIKTIVIVFSVLGLFLSLIVSGFVYTTTRKSFTEVLDDSQQVGSSLFDLIETVQNESNNVREASIEQAAAIQESVSALSEMSSMISQTSGNVKLSLETSKNAIKKTAEGKEIMNRLEGSMSSIQSSSTQLQELSKVIENISIKAGIINDIVFKTQLLSFNASIEAARAGQHGRGFSVVAEEVGNLAEMSGQAAKDIEILLEDSQRKVKATVEVIQSRLSDSNRVSQLAHQTFQEVASNIEEINSQVRSINEATLQQEIGIQQTNVAMKQVDTTSQNNTESASNALMLVNELKQKGDLLNKANSNLSFLIKGKSKFVGKNATIEKKNFETKIVSFDSNSKELNQFSNRSIDINSISADDPDFKKIAS